MFRRRRFFADDSPAGERPGIAWFNPDGTEMTATDWADDAALAFALFLNGDRISETDTRGAPVDR